MRSVYEKEGQKRLEAEGYQVDFKTRPFRCPKGYRIDIFGLFDLMAYKPGELRFIAIKGKAGVPAKLKREIAALDFPPGVTKEIWDYDKTRDLGFVRKQKLHP